MHMEEGRKSLSEVHASVEASSRKGWRKLWAFMGPAYLVSVGYMDPGNWATDIAGGSQFGYTLIWVLLMSNLMALLLQSLSARLGVVRQLDLAQASREEYRPGVNYALWLMAEIAIAATDLAEVLGMAIGLQLLFGLPLIWGVSLTVLDTLLILVLHSFGMRKMEAFIVALVAVIGGAFLVEMILAKPNMSELMIGFIPSLPNDTALYIAIGIIGATVMPHNLYLHSSLVQTRRIDSSTEKGIWSALKYNLIDSTIALNAAFFVNAAILVLAASTFFKAGMFEVAEIQDAHQLLAPLLGTELAPILFGVALLAAGQSSTITGTLSGQIVMEGYLHIRIAPWLRRLITRLIAIIPAYIVILLYGERETGPLLVLSQVILSLQLGFAIIPLIHFTSDKVKMGVFANKMWVKILAWTIAIVIIGLNVQLVINEVTGWLKEAEDPWIILVTVIPVCIAAAVLLVYITFKPLIDRRSLDKASRIPHGTAVTLENINKPIYNRIAVAIDFTSVDSTAIQSALAQGGTMASYLLIHVVETAGAMVYGSSIADKESSVDNAALQNYASQLIEKGYEVEIKIGYGNPKRRIPAMVKEFNADLLVMGAHGHNFIKDLIFGTTVDTVRHRVEIPVFIVRESQP
ncbi:MAG: Nramp family divalent metal transporter [Cyclobacteriaceae bacterium]|nr:Nramp family divalent metal transporter [Cyclobacteriaceae bacterium]